MEKLEKVDQNNTILLIEKPLMNHATKDTKIMHTTLSVSEEDVNTNEFSESDTNNENNNENVESKILCDKE